MKNFNFIESKDMKTRNEYKRLIDYDIKGNNKEIKLNNDNHHNKETLDMMGMNDSKRLKTNIEITKQEGKIENIQNKNDMKINTNLINKKQKINYERNSNYKGQNENKEENELRYNKKFKEENKFKRYDKYMKNSINSANQEINHKEINENKQEICNKEFKKKKENTTEQKNCKTDDENEIIKDKGNVKINDIINNKYIQEQMGYRDDNNKKEKNELNEIIRSKENEAFKDKNDFKGLKELKNSINYSFINNKNSAIFENFNETGNHISDHYKNFENDLKGSNSKETFMKNIFNCVNNNSSLISNINSSITADKSLSETFDVRKINSHCSFYNITPSYYKKEKLMNLAFNEENQQYEYNLNKKVVDDFSDIKKRIMMEKLKYQKSIKVNQINSPNPQNKSRSKF